MEYNPNIFSLYEKPIAESDKSAASMLNNKLLKQCGKFERNKVKTGCKDQQSALAVFLVASVLEAKNKRILKEAKGLDDVVQVTSLPPSSPPSFSMPVLFVFEKMNLDLSYWVAFCRY